MDPVERAMGRLDNQRIHLLEEKQEMEQTLFLGIFKTPKKVLQREIRLLEMKIEAIDYVINFLENTEED